jgi:hypothetical protein
LTLGFSYTEFPAYKKADALNLMAQKVNWGFSVAASGQHFRSFPAQARE